jgi:hypothetical protein
MLVLSTEVRTSTGIPRPPNTESSASTARLPNPIPLNTHIQIRSVLVPPRAANVRLGRVVRLRHSGGLAPLPRIFIHRIPDSGHLRIEKSGRICHANYRAIAQGLRCRLQIIGPALLTAAYRQTRQRKPAPRTPILTPRQT